MPDEARFFDGDGRTRSEAYYSVLGPRAGALERRAEHRLKRSSASASAMTPTPSRNACAEIGAAFLCARLGIAHEPHPDHARYVHHWLKVMKDDARAIFAAAASAQEAVTYLDGLQATAAQQIRRLNQGGDTMLRELQHIPLARLQGVQAQRAQAWCQGHRQPRRLHCRASA